MDPGAILAAFAAELTWERIPASVRDRTKDLLVDWFGSALAGRTGRPVQAIARLAAAMGPDDGACEILISRRRTSPMCAAMVNAAASHFVEQDDELVSAEAGDGVIGGAGVAAGGPQGVVQLPRDLDQ